LSSVALFRLWPAFAPTRIEHQMTPEQFRAAGLDRLTPEQLANLNAWLNRKIDTVSETVAAEAKKKVEDDNRGFFHFGSMEPITGRLQGEFRGFRRGREYTLESGQVWRQVDDAELGGVRVQDPEVTLKPAMIGNVWYMGVKGYNTGAKVERVK